MTDTPFYGREEELERLEGLLKKKTSSLVVIKEASDWKKPTYCGV